MSLHNKYQVFCLRSSVPGLSCARYRRSAEVFYLSLSPPPFHSVPTWLTVLLLDWPQCTITIDGHAYTRGFVPASVTTGRRSRSCPFMSPSSLPPPILQPCSPPCGRIVRPVSAPCESCATIKRRRPGSRVPFLVGSNRG